jgi:hypothetical protein
VTDGQSQTNILEVSPESTLDAGQLKLRLRSMIVEGTATNFTKLHEWITNDSWRIRSIRKIRGFSFGFPKIVTAPATSLDLTHPSSGAYFPSAQQIPRCPVVRQSERKL